MYSKIILTLSALSFFIIGIPASFAPELLLSFLKVDYTITASMFVQGFGAFNFAMGIQNWMSRAGLIGGIYNRPLVMANLTYFFMFGLAIYKGLIISTDKSIIICSFEILFLILALAFGIVLFKDPIATRK